MDPVRPLISLNAILWKVCHAGTVENRAAHLAVGVDGRREVLGIWVEHTS